MAGNHQFFSNVLSKCACILKEEKKKTTWFEEENWTSNTDFFYKYSLNFYWNRKNRSLSNCSSKLDKLAAARVKICSENQNLGKRFDWLLILFSIITHVWNGFQSFAFHFSGYIDVIAIFNFSLFSCSVTTLRF